MDYRITFKHEGDMGPLQDAYYVAVYVWRDDEPLGMWTGLVDRLSRVKLNISTENQAFWRAMPTVLAREIQAVFEGRDTPPDWCEWKLDARELRLDARAIRDAGRDGPRAEDWEPGDELASWSE